jgi:hypothetical protein
MNSIYIAGAYSRRTSHWMRNRPDIKQRKISWILWRKKKRANISTREENS